MRIFKKEVNFVSNVRNQNSSTQKAAEVLNLTKGEAADKLGINRLTYGRLESPTRNEKVRQSTYERITEWLAKDY